MKKIPSSLKYIAIVLYICAAMAGSAYLVFGPPQEAPAAGTTVTPE